MKQRDLKQLLQGNRSDAFRHFLHLWYTHIAPELPEDPLATLLKLIEEKTPLTEDYFMSGRWLFRIRGHQLWDIKVVPVLSGHARYRLMTRFGISPEEAEKRFLLDFAKSKGVAQQIRDRLYLDKYDTALKASNRIYLMKDNTVVTVLDANWNE